MTGENGYYFKQNIRIILWLKDNLPKSKESLKISNEDVKLSYVKEKEKFVIEVKILKIYLFESCNYAINCGDANYIDLTRKI
jgi:hypothetical protein